MAGTAARPASHPQSLGIGKRDRYRRECRKWIERWIILELDCMSVHLTKKKKMHLDMNTSWFRFVFEGEKKKWQHLVHGLVRFNPATCISPYSEEIKKQMPHWLLIGDFRHYQVSTERITPNTFCTHTSGIYVGIIHYTTNPRS